MKQTQKHLVLASDTKTVPLTEMLIPAATERISEREERGEYLFRQVENRLNTMISLLKNQLN